MVRDDGTDASNCDYRYTNKMLIVQVLNRHFPVLENVAGSETTTAAFSKLFP